MDRAALIVCHDALPTAAERAAFRAEHGISRTALANSRKRLGLNPTTCACGTGLVGRQRRCDGCKAASEREAHVRRVYALSPAEYAALVAASGGRCDACGEAPSATGSRSQRALHVDHDHLTGSVRGLVCHPCNLALGYAQESAPRLRALADYLTRT